MGSRSLSILTKWGRTVTDDTVDGGAVRLWLAVNGSGFESAQLHCGVVVTSASVLREPVAAAVCDSVRGLGELPPPRRDSNLRSCPVHPTWHCTNPDVQAGGVPFAVSAVNAKVRRAGYRR